MSISFTGSINNAIIFEQNILKQSEETLRTANDEIVPKFENLMEQDIQFQKGYQGDSKLAYQNAINTLYGRCKELSEIQTHFADELSLLAEESQKINEQADTQISLGE